MWIRMTLTVGFLFLGIAAVTILTFSYIGYVTTYCKPITMTLASWFSINCTPQNVTSLSPLKK
jgi:hypothetical protein